ncbi:hypothetical protein JCM18909_2574 [Cutibacterium acnes JCM 18909]|nr:hypothetical protein JCM18909_2574 [Cutibacterium acnes JCM 18909]
MVPILSSPLREYTFHPILATQQPLSHRKVPTRQQHPPKFTVSANDFGVRRPLPAGRTMVLLTYRWKDGMTRMSTMTRLLKKWSG